MALEAACVLSRQRKSFEAGVEAGRELLEQLTAPPAVVVVHMTVNHEQGRFLEGLRQALGAEVPIIGCSGQGVMGRGQVHEDGYAATLLALGGSSLRVSVARVDEIARATGEKAAELGRSLREQLGERPRVTLLYFDPLAGADMSRFLAALDGELDGLVVGGAASHFFSAAMTTTYQYFGGEVVSGAAVAVSLAGDFHAESDWSLGVTPVGLRMTVTKATGTRIQELDGRVALDVWKEITGSDGLDDPLANSSMAIGVPVGPAGGDQIRAVLVLDQDVPSLTLQAGIETGTMVTFYHRTVENVLEGTRRLGRDLKAKLSNKKLRAVIGFECGGRTKPFLGVADTMAENGELQSCLGTEAAWFGLVCWGEVFAVDGRTSLHNYTFPVLTLSESA